MTEILRQFFFNLFNYSISHNVNPYVLMIIYIGSIPFVYYPVFVFYQIRTKKIEKRFVAKKVTGSIIISVTAIISPYAYVIVFSRDLPWWFISILTVFGVIGSIYTVKKFQYKGE